MWTLLMAFIGYILVYSALKILLNINIDLAAKALNIDMGNEVESMIAAPIIAEYMAQDTKVLVLVLALMILTPWKFFVERSH